MLDVCPDAGDSPLSTVANILGIITFGLALFAYVAAFFTVTRKADDEIEATRASAETMTKNLVSVIDILNARNNRGADLDLVDLFEPMQVALHAYEMAVKDLKELLKRFQPTKSKQHIFTPHYSICHRFLWWYAEKERLSAINNIMTSHQLLIAVQLAYLDR